MLNKTKLKLLFVSFVLLLSLTAVSANENNTFTDLQTAIDESGNEVNINRDYAYNNTADGKYGDGIVISNRELVINGNGYAFDGSDQARILLVNQCNLTVNNLILTNGLSQYGSGIYAKNSNIILNNVTFKNMNSSQAGVCLINSGSLTIEDSSFMGLRFTSIARSLSATVISYVLSTYLPPLIFRVYVPASRSAMQ